MEKILQAQESIDYFSINKNKYFELNKRKNIKIKGKGLVFLKGEKIYAKVNINFGKTEREAGVLMQKLGHRSRRKEIKG